MKLYTMDELLSEQTYTAPDVSIQQLLETDNVRLLEIIESQQETIEMLAECVENLSKFRIRRCENGKP